MKKVLLIIIIGFLSSCSSIENTNFKILKSYLKDKKREKQFEEICNSSKIKIPDTIIIDTIARSNRTLERYFFTEKNDSINTSLILINCKDKFFLSENDLNIIKNQILKSDGIEMIKSSKLTFDKFKVISNGHNKSISSKCKIIYHFSKPIISYDNNYSMFYFECSVDTLSKQYSMKSDYILMKKNNKKWVFVGELCKNDILD